ncbi:MAG: hypothetical protein GYA41_08300 [Bacteroidales bacterium]|nr:hypothetical protein [Bacteroidales bacterium]
MKTKLLITILAFFAMAALVNAQNTQSDQAQQNTAPGYRGAYIDSNNNGVCDNFEIPRNYYRNGGRRMMNATGPGNRRGLQPGQGRGLGPGQGRGLGPGQGRGQAPGGRFYVDSDKNGVCDYYEKTVKK